MAMGADYGFIITSFAIESRKQQCINLKFIKLCLNNRMMSLFIQ